MDGIARRKRIAIAFYGLCRSLDKTIDSIQDMLITRLRSAGYDVDIYVHTYVSDKPYRSAWSGENQLLDNEQYRLLSAKGVSIDDRDEVVSRIDFTPYCLKPDPWGSSDHECTRNLVLGLFSLKRCAAMIDMTRYDYVIVTRPDCIFKTAFDPKWLQVVDDKSALAPNFAQSSGVNDRFLVATPAVAKQYMNRLDIFGPYSRKHTSHSERFTKHVLDGAGVDVIHIPLYFHRLRAHGRVAYNDLLVNVTS